MATWEDGPEYAPIQRPEGFTVPEAPPLSVAPDIDHPAAGAPAARPAFADPADPVSALETLVPEDKDPRDPSVPFTVVTSAATATDSAWSAAHWSRPDGEWDAPTGAAAGPYDPTIPLEQHHPYGNQPTSGGFPTEGGPLPTGGPYGEPGPSGFPAPGTTDWFATPPSAMAPQAPQADAVTVLKYATPGVLITLGLGCLVPVIAPLTLAVAFALSTRIMVAQAAIRKVFLGGLGVLAFFALVGALTRSDSFGDWWGFVGLWALLISWVVGIALLVTIHRALKSPGRHDSGYQRPWA